MTPRTPSYLSYNWPDPEYSGGSGHISISMQFFSIINGYLKFSDENKMGVPNY